MLIRPLTVFEREGIRNFYLALSEDDRRLRFCSLASDETVNDYVARLDFAQATVLGLFDARAQIIGLAELVRGVVQSELAFAVRADMRGRKLGTRLMERMLARARICGVRKVHVMFLSEYTPMRKLAIRAGMQMRRDGGETYASLRLEAPRAEELVRWFVEDSFSHGGYFSTLMMARWGSLVDMSIKRPKGLDAITA
jgi:GNAT superfamily N-acetyltransferase